MTHMRVCVTGAAGFIGSHVCQRLAHHAEIVALDDLSTGLPENLEGQSVRFVQGSILDVAALDEVVGGADAIVHLAARPSVPRSLLEPDKTHDANATGTLRVLEAARRHGDVYTIVASSSSVYGANPVLPKREDLCPQPMSPYAVSKLAAEQYALAWQNSFGVPTLAFRFFNVFGPRQAPGSAYAAVVPAFVHAALTGRPLTVHGDGTQTRDFTHVHTVTEVITDAVLRRVSHPTPVNLAFGTRTSLIELVGVIEAVLGTSLERSHVEPRRGDVPHSQADSSVVRHLFPDVRAIDLTEGVRSTIEWMRGWL